MYDECRAYIQSSRNLFYWCRTAVRQTVIFCRTDKYLQDWRHICCQNIIFFAKIRRTFVRQTKNFCRTKWKNAGFVRQSCTFREDCTFYQKCSEMVGFMHKNDQVIKPWNTGQGHKKHCYVKWYCQFGPSCSKLTMSLVNDSLKFTSSDMQIFWNFLQCKSYSHFFSKKYQNIVYWIR